MSDFEPKFHLLPFDAPKVTSTEFPITVRIQAYKRIKGGVATGEIAIHTEMMEEMGILGQHLLRMFEAGFKELENGH